MAEEINQKINTKVSPAEIAKQNALRWEVITSLQSLPTYFASTYALVSILWGAGSALPESKLRRFLAYAGVSQAGFLLLAASFQ